MNLQKGSTYLIMILNMIAKKFGMTLHDAYDFVSRHKGIAFLTEFYDVEHTLNSDDVVDDVLAICEKHGGVLACLNKIMNNTKEQDYLIQNVISHLVAEIAEEQNLSLEKAMELFFTSDLSKKITDVETGYYLESPSYLYEIFQQLQDVKTA